MRFDLAIWLYVAKIIVKCMLALYTTGKVQAKGQ